MLSVGSIRNACPRCRVVASRSLAHNVSSSTKLPGWRRALEAGRAGRPRSSVAPRRLSTRPEFGRKEDQGLLEDQDSLAQDAAEMEALVRSTKQRFRDTLPKDYLNEAEYALYVRLYGPPLRETTPEDVGIPSHADQGEYAPPRPDNEGTLLRELEGGQLEEVTYQIPLRAGVHDEGRQAGEVDELAAAEGDASVQTLARTTPTYIEATARNEREYKALQKLMGEYEAAKKQTVEETAEEEAEADEAALAGQDTQELAGDDASSWPQEWKVPEGDAEAGRSGEAKRFHRHTLEGKFHGSPVELRLPHDELVAPIRTLLERTHPRHVKGAAESAFGGAGLPRSPATPAWLRSGHMGGVGLPPGQRHMTEIEADVFLAAYMPPAYASIMSILREVRKRIGPDWLQSRLKKGKDGELSVLDVGAGGAALIAWEQIVRAEWQVLKDKGEVRGARPPGKKTVVAGSDRLRQRIKTMLDNTTFLPRLPDYAHSGETVQGEHVDAGREAQPRKLYDVIVASHLFLQEKQEHHRQAVLNTLWSLLNEDGGILVVVEKAHPRGFEAVAHVRQTLLDRFLQSQPAGEHGEDADEEGRSPGFNPAFDREREPGYIIAPCTNHTTCPLYRSPGRSTGRKDYCHFDQRFVKPQFYSEVLGTPSNQGRVQFSYLAVRRGRTRERGGGSLSGVEATRRAFEGYEASSSSSSSSSSASPSSARAAAGEPDMLSLPRLIWTPLKRKGHVTLDVCTAEGQAERWTVPRSFSEAAYHDARKARWGDLWALGAKTRVPRSTRTGTAPEEKFKKSRDQKKPRVVGDGDNGGSDGDDFHTYYDDDGGDGGGDHRRQRDPRKERKVARNRKRRERDMLRAMMAQEADEEDAEFADREFDKETRMEWVAEKEEEAVGHRGQDDEGRNR